MKKQRKAPPAWLTRFIEWYCHPGKAEDLLGDLEEYYTRNLEKGQTWANWQYLLDTVKFLRPYLLKSTVLKFKPRHMYLFNNYLKTAVRSIRRNRLFSGINLIGLGISMTVCLLMIAYIAELLSYDNFHSKGDRIYRVTNHYHNLVGDSFEGEFASTSLLAGKRLQEDVSGVEHVAIIRRGFSDDLRKGDQAINVEGYYTESQFWDIFSFELIKGSAKSSLSLQESLVLSETAAIKLFGEEDPLGKVVAGKDGNYTITGIMKDVPFNSHMQFEALVPLAKIEAQKAAEGDHDFLGWRNMWSNYVYFTLPEGGQPHSIQESLNGIAEIENAQSDRYAITLSLEKLSDIIPGDSRSNEIGPNFEWLIVYLLSGLTMIVMISACFNYTNLSIARSLRRSKEVGIRKVIGANRQQVTWQFLIEAMVISLCSLLIAWLLFFVVRSGFIAVFTLGDMYLKASSFVIGASVIFALVMGLMAGILPAIFLSKLPPVAILRDISSRKVFRGVSLRRILIIFQLSLSIAFVISTATAHRQYQYSINFDLGFQTENIINLELEGNDPDLLGTEIERLPEIKKASKSALVMSIGSMWSEPFTYQDPMDSTEIYLNYVDRAFTDLHDFNFLAGTTFVRDLRPGDSSRHMIVDQLTLNRFGVGTPDEAIGQKLHMTEDGKKRPYEIVGVIDAFQYGRVDWKKAPTAFIQGEPDQFRFLNLLTQAGSPLELMSKIEKAYRSIDDLHPMQASFYDEQIDRAYVDFSKSFQIFSFLAVLAVCIALMGFLGIAVFTMETRIKEISVRKILGATEQQLVFLLSRGFVLLIIVAVVIATPLTYLLFDRVILDGFANRTPLGLDLMASGGLFVLCCAAPIVLWQTLRTARTNPAETLRND